MSKATNIEKFERRRGRVRARVRGTKIKPRLMVFLSHQHIYCQMIDDERGVTLVATSDCGGMSAKTMKRTKTLHAEEVGAEIATKALALGIMTVVFDKSGYAFHGRVKALADAARNAGLQF